MTQPGRKQRRGELVTRPSWTSPQSLSHSEQNKWTKYGKHLFFPHTIKAGAVLNFSKCFKVFDIWKYMFVIKSAPFNSRNLAKRSFFNVASKICSSGFRVCFHKLGRFARDVILFFLHCWKQTGFSRWHKHQLINLTTHQLALKTFIHVFLWCVWCLFAHVSRLEGNINLYFTGFALISSSNIQLFTSDKQNYKQN